MWPTSPPANGLMPIAHLRTYVPGDVFVRYLRKLGQDTLFICGSNTHDTPITIKAEKVLQAFNLAPSPKIDEAPAPLKPGQPLPRP